MGMKAPAGLKHTNNPLRVRMETEGIQFACAEECHVVTSEFELVTAGPVGPVTISVEETTNR